MKILYLCERCGIDFSTKEACLRHEENCKGNEMIFLCHKCGEVIKWNIKDSNAFVKENQCHTIDLGEMGYGSKLDSWRVKIDLCDNCLCDFINTLRYEEEAVF